MKLIKITKSPRVDKKYAAIIETDEGATVSVSFGAKKLVDGVYVPYSDYTQHKDEERKNRYLERHRDREDWTKTGILTPGFWARWILWNKPTLRESVRDVVKRFNL